MLDEDAVAAGVATHIGEGDENLAGVSDLPSPVLIADFTCPLKQARKSGVADAVCRVDVIGRDHGAGRQTVAGKVLCRKIRCPNVAQTRIPPLLRGQPAPVASACFMGSSSHFLSSDQNLTV